MSAGPKSRSQPQLVDGFEVHDVDSLITVQLQTPANQLVANVTVSQSQANTINSWVLKHTLIHLKVAHSFT